MGIRGPDRDDDEILVGDTANQDYANYTNDNCCDEVPTGADRWEGRTAPVGSFQANAFGVFDMLGNVWEWVEDCYNANYKGAPMDGRVWTGGACGSRVMRGGSWINYVDEMGSSVRKSDYPGDCDCHYDECRSRGASLTGSGLPGHLPHEFLLSSWLWGVQGRCPLVRVR